MALNRDSSLRVRAEKRLRAGKGGKASLLRVKAPKGVTVQGAQKFYTQHGTGTGGGETAAQRKQRIHKAAVGRHNVYLNDPNALVPGGGLSRKQLSTDTQSAINLKYGAANQQLATQAQNIPSYFQDYLSALQTSQAAQQQYAQGVQAGVQGLATADTANGQSPEALAALKSRQALVGAGAANIGAQAVNQSAFNTNLQGIGQRQKVASLLQNQTDRANLKKEMGDYGNQYKATTLAATRNYALSAGALHLNTSTAAQKAAAAAAAQAEKTRHDKAGEKISATEPSKAKTQAELDYFNKHGYWPPTGPPKTPKAGSGPASFTPTQVRKSKSTYRTAVQWARSHNPNPSEYQDLVHALTAPKGGSKGQTVTVHDPTTGKIIYNPDGTPKTKTTGGSEGGQGLDPLFAKAVAMMAIYNGVDAKTRRRVLSQFGIRLPVQKAPKAGPFKGTGRPKGQRPT